MTMKKKFVQIDTKDMFAYNVIYFTDNYQSSIGSIRSRVQSVIFHLICCVFLLIEQIEITFAFEDKFERTC